MMKLHEEWEEKVENDFLAPGICDYREKGALGMRETGKDYLDSIFTFIAFILAFFLLILIPWIKNSGALRWMCILLALGIVVSLLLRIFHKRSIPLINWRNRNELDVVVGSKLKETSDLVRRSSEGLEMSQALLEERIRDDFVEEMKYGRGLSDSEVKELLEDPNRLRNFVGDDIILDFLIHCKDYRETGGDKKLFSNVEVDIKSNEDYRKRIEKVIDRMENWS